jgi:cytochrome c556
MQRLMAETVAILIITTCLFSTADAAAKPEDAIKYRHSVMESMSGHVNAFVLIATNKIDSPQYLQNHADAIANLSSELETLFPAGSGQGDTDALPAIWDDVEKFSKAVAKMQETANSLQQVAGSGDTKAIMGAFAAAGKSCKGCHETFRAEEDDDDSDSHDHDDHEH